jgi:putative SbcD/Mre11-related phosphoesterase
MVKIKQFEVVDRCLFWKEKKILIVGDLHLGYEDNLASRGFAVPRSQFMQTKEIFEKIFNKIGKVDKILLLGDVKHVFGKIMKQEFFDFEQLITLFTENLIERGEIIITKGNHDTILENISRKYEKITLCDKYIIGKTLFLHGDSKSVRENYECIKDKKIKLIVVGHFHPAYILKDKNSVKQEKFKCFLYGFSSEYQKEVIFTPSFFPLIEGSDIIQELEIYEKGMKAILIDGSGKTYDFGKIK